MYNKRYYSQAQIESDQKDIIIAQLKADIFEMRKNEEDYYTLQEQLRKLEHKFKIASEDKIISDEEYRNRHENIIRNINLFKQDCDHLSNEIAQKNRDISDLNQDNNSLKQQCDLKAAEISRIKNQIDYLLGKQEQNKQEINSLQIQEDLARDDKKALINRLEDVNHASQEYQKRISVLTAEQQDLEEKVMKFNRKAENQDQENQQLETEIKKMDIEIENFEERNKDLRKNIRIQEQDIQSVENSLLKHQNELRHYQLVTQNEKARNEDLLNRTNVLEQLLRNKEKQIEELQQDIDGIQKENQELDSQNNDQNTDLAALEKHKKTLQLANDQLLDTLHRYCDQDEQVREILNRRKQLAVFSQRSYKDQSLAQSHRRQASGQKSILKGSPSKFSYYE